MKTTLQEVIESMQGMLNALQKETQPISGHDDPGAIIDCFAELRRSIDELPGISISEHEAKLLKFSEWAGEHFIRLNTVWCNRYLDQRDKGNWISTQDLYKRFCQLPQPYQEGGQNE